MASPSGFTPRARRGFTGVLVVISMLWAQASLAQVFVLPRRAGKTPVRHFEFEWRHVDILVGPRADTSAAGDEAPPPSAQVDHAGTPGATANAGGAERGSPAAAPKQDAVRLEQPTRDAAPWRSAKGVLPLQGMGGSPWDTNPSSITELAKPAEDPWREPPPKRATPKPDGGEPAPPSQPTSESAERSAAQNPDAGTSARTQSAAPSKGKSAPATGAKADSTNPAPSSGANANPTARGADARSTTGIAQPSIAPLPSGSPPQRTSTAGEHRPTANAYNAAPSDPNLSARSEAEASSAALPPLSPPPFLPPLEDAPSSPEVEAAPPGEAQPELPHPKEDELAKNLEERSGGVRLYFYDRESEVAARAAGQIARAYRYLVDEFSYVPNRTFPYVLYNTYAEFLQTNLFPVSEGTLGVTSTQGDLRLSLPYFGDHRLFEDVSTHEMAHQFTIQKVRTYAARAKVGGDPLDGVPLWFVEGLAEYYAKHGLDDETKMLVRDLLINPDVRRSHVLEDFFSEEPLSFLGVYKVGQARCAFLEAEYGRGTIQRILEQSPSLVRGFGFFTRSPRDFRRMLERITGDKAQVISQKFESWMKRRSFNTFLEAKQEPAAFEPLRDARGDPALDDVDSLSVSSSGEILLVRTINRTTGQSELRLLSRKAPRDQVRLAKDGIPGTESLHPVFGRNFTVNDSAAAYVAEVGGFDVLYWVPFETNVRPREKEDDVEEEAHPTDQFDASFKLGKRARYRLDAHGIWAATSPAFSPDGKRVAFIGMDSRGQRDVYVLEPRGKGNEFILTRVTSDVYAERQLAWGPTGIIFTSDATEHSRFNLFRVEPGGTPERLTTEPRDHQDPVALRDGRIFFMAYDDGRANLNEWVNGSVVRRTDVATGLLEPQAGPDGSLWALEHESGQRTAVQVPPKALLTLSTHLQPPGGEPRELPIQPVDGSQAYRSFAPRNWSLGPTMAFLGVGLGGVAGEVVSSANDRLNNHALILNFALLGRFELAEGYLLYVNQVNRATWAVGPFQALNFRLDRTFSGLPFTFTSVERFYGGTASVRYPFNTFLYAQGELGVGAATYTLLPFDQDRLADPTQTGFDGSLVDAWRSANSGTRFQSVITGRLGYDTVQVHPLSGPLNGTSVLFENTVGVQPVNRTVFGNVRLDAEHFFQLIGRSNIVLRAGVGTAYGGTLTRQYLLSSFDTLRGARFGDLNWLLGSNFLFSTAEVRIPLDGIIRIALINNIQAVGGMDFGGVGDSPALAFDKRILDGVVGANIGLGPLLFRLHFAKPINTGSPFGVPSRDWVTNFSVRIAGLEGLLGDTKGPVHRSMVMQESRAF